MEGWVRRGLDTFGDVILISGTIVQLALEYPESRDIYYTVQSLVSGSRGETGSWGGGLSKIYAEQLVPNDRPI